MQYEYIHTHTYTQKKRRDYSSQASMFIVKFVLIGSCTKTKIHSSSVLTFIYPFQFLSRPQPIMKKNQTQKQNKSRDAWKLTTNDKIEGADKQLSEQRELDFVIEGQTDQIPFF